MPRAIDGYKAKMAAQPPAGAVCAHRGQVTSTIKKEVCCGRTADFKVYGCAIHGECCLAGAVTKYVCPCPDFAAATDTAGRVEATTD